MLVTIDSFPVTRSLRVISFDRTINYYRKYSELNSRIPQISTNGEKDKILSFSSFTRHNMQLSHLSLLCRCGKIEMFSTWGFADDLLPTFTYIVKCLFL